MKPVVFLMVLWLCNFSTTAQYLPNECGTPSSKTDFLRNIPQKSFRTSAGTRVIKMYLVIYQDDDGSNQAMPEEEVKKEILYSDSVYSIGNICFAIVGIEFRKSTFYNNPMYPQDYSGQVVDDAFTVFVVKTISGNLFGWSPDIISSHMITKQDGFGTRRTFIHEMGHALGLDHTFKGTAHDPDNPGCDELVNGTNGTSCGDFVKDTPADPYDRCGQAASGCTFSYPATTCKDANNQGYAPQMNNYMSYWANYGCNRSTFTNGQYSRMVAAIDNDGTLSSFLADEYVNLSGATISSDFVTEAAQHQLTTANYTLNGSVQAGLSASSVVLKPGTVMAPGADGVVRVMASYCQ